MLYFPIIYPLKLIFWILFQGFKVIKLNSGRIEFLLKGKCFITERTFIALKFILNVIFMNGRVLAKRTFYSFSKTELNVLYFYQLFVLYTLLSPQRKNRYSKGWIAGEVLNIRKIEKTTTYCSALAITQTKLIKNSSRQN